MTLNQVGEVGRSEPLLQRVAPWRERAASGMRLSVSPPPPPTILKQPRHTLVGIPPAAPAGARSAPARSVPPPLPARATAKAKVVVDRDDENENEDDVTDIYAERATLVFAKDANVEETTRELPWPTLRRLPTPEVLPPPMPLPPTGFHTISASLAAASLPSPGFTEALARENEARTPPRIVVPQVGRPLRVGGAVAVAAVVALVAFARSPSQGTIVVDAIDPHGGPVSRLDVFVDGEKTACQAAPCSVPGARGLHEVKVVAEGFEAPATQGVAVASGSPTTVHFLVSPPREPEVQFIGSSPVALEPLPPEMPIPTSPVAAPPAAEPVTPSITPTPAQARRTTAAPPVYSSSAASVSKPSVTPPAGAGVAAHDAYLNLNSIPASTCFLDGRSLGSTPRLRVEVAAGSHTVKFRAPGSGSTKTLLVKVGAGETRLAVARLD